MQKYYTPERLYVFEEFVAPASGRQKLNLNERLNRGIMFIVYHFSRALFEKPHSSSSAGKMPAVQIAMVN
jgi:hypothetical protein